MKSKNMMASKNFKILVLVLVTTLAFIFPSHASALSAPVITSPSGWFNWEIGKTYQVAWTWDQTQGFIDISLVNKNTGQQVINPATGQIYKIGNNYSTSPVSWTIPSFLEVGGTYEILLSIYPPNSSSFAIARSWPIQIDASTTITPPTSPVSVQNPPVIDSNSPNQGLPGETIKIVLRGRNFTGANNFSGGGIAPLLDTEFRLKTSKQVLDTEAEATYY